MANQEHEYEELKVEYRGNNIYAKSLLNETEEKQEDRIGLMVGGASWKDKPVEIKNKELLPLHKVMSEASWGGRTEVYDNKFFYFGNGSLYDSYAFGLNEYQNDYIPFLEAFNNTFEIASGYIIKTYDASKSSIKCGGRQCNGAKNWMMYFSKNKFSDEHDSHNKDFQIIPDNTAISPLIKGCEKYGGPDKAHYLCFNDSLALLLFESRDSP
jgi:hypothetical protein